MSNMPDRRRFLKHSLAASLGSRAGSLPWDFSLDSERGGILSFDIARLERESGGRLGVCLLDVESGEVSGYRVKELFPLCSTFKVLAVAAALAKADSKRLDLYQTVPISSQDILKYAPTTSQHIGPNGLTLVELCEAAVVLSDNTAANLILKSIGGTEAVTHFARSLNDRTTRLDRNEPTLNEANPGDPRDTTSPIAMAEDLKELLCGSVLSASSRSLLKRWMVDCKTGAKKIRSGFPPAFVVADKTGSGDHNTSNDIAAIWPDGGRPPIILTVYLTQAASDSADKQAETIAAVSRRCFEYYSRRWVR